MRPATSGRTVTDSSERRLPTAVIVCGSAWRITFVASTTVGAPDGASAAVALRAGASAAIAAGRTVRCRTSSRPGGGNDTRARP